LLRPTGITGLTATCVEQKIREQGFARCVKREDLDLGAAFPRVITPPT
jgi:hypothetical protein